MELNQQVANLTDDVKVLKGEIKTILTELRTAVLSSRNPFSSDAGRLSSGNGDGASSLDVAAKDETASEEPATPAAAGAPALSIVPPGAPDSAGSSGPPPAIAAGPPAAAGPGSPDATVRFSASPDTSPNGPPASASVPPAAEPKGDPQPAKGWSLLTVISLAAWAEEAVAQLGPKSFQVVLDISRLAELITPETRDVLITISQLSPEREGQERPIKINECLVLVRQLEAILYGGQDRGISQRS